MKAQFRRHAAALIFFFLASAFLCRGLFEGKILVDLGGDELKCYFSAVSYTHTWVKAGILPLWNTLSLGGHPFGIHAVSSYNLANLAAFFFRPETAYSAVVFLGIYLNGYFFYLFLRGRGAGLFAAVASGWVWMIPRRETEVGFFFLPLLFVLAAPYAERPTGKRLFFFTLALALYFLNSNPHSAIYNTIFVLAYLTFLLKESKEGGFSTAFKVILPVLLAIGLTAFYSARAFELYGLSNRASRGEIVAFLPTHYPLLLFPNLFYSPAGPQADFVIPRILQTIFSHIPFMKAVEVFPIPLYSGAAAVIAFFYASSGKRSALANFFWWVVVLVLAYLTLHPILYLLFIRYLPVLKGLVGVHRLFMIEEFSLLALLAVSLGEWLVVSEEKSRKLLSLARRMAVGAFIFTALLASLRVLVEALRPKLTAVILSNLRAASAPSIFIGDFETFSHERVRQFFQYFERVLSWDNPHLVWPLCVFAVFLALIIGYQKMKMSRRFFQGVFFLWMALDVGLVLGFSRPAFSREAIFKGARPAEFFKHDTGLFRVLMVEDAKTPYSSIFLAPEANLIYGIATPDGYEYLYLKRYVRFYEWLTLRPEGMGPYIHPLHHFNKDAADFLNVKYFLTSSFNESFEHRPDMQKRWEGEGVRIYENLGALPRAFIVHRAVHFLDEEAAAGYLKKNLDRMRSEVVLEGAALSEGAVGVTSDSESVRFLRYEPHEVLLEARLKSDGYLVMSENHYPGWKAKVDGRPAELLRANTTFRAVRLAKGEHRIRMVYDPASVKMGLWISLAALGVLSILCAARKF